MKWVQSTSVLASLGLGLSLFGVTNLPATNTYKLNSYGFGSGGTANSSTNTYSLEGSSGELSGRRATNGGTTQTNPGYIETQQANLPKLAAFDNNGNVYYNKLHFTIDSQANPSDAKYLIAVSTVSNFSSNVQYVQPDGTLSSTLNLTDYQTYASWGASSGSTIVGLDYSTTYYAHIKATQGRFSESGYGPASAATTSAPSITFNLVTSAQASPPFSVDIGSLDTNVIATSTDTINTTLSTNGASGGDVYLTSLNGGLKSNRTGNQINAVSNDLSTVSKGFGAQNSFVGQTSGGPYSVASPYSVSGTNVGIVNSTTRSLYTSNNPITAGAGRLLLKAKSASSDIASTDYQEVLTFVAAANF